MKQFLFFSIILAPVFNASGQDFQTKEWPSPANTQPLIFYISGDGGFNKFSTGLCESLNAKGFDVIALNAKSYFWKKKTPDQTTADISNFLNKKLAGRKNQQIIFIGYSFGADILPFILNRLPQNTQAKITASVLMASSGSTDFEIHLSDFFGSAKKRSMDVITEINKLINGKIIIINASDDQDLEIKKITLKKFVLEVLPGGHHFEGDIAEVTKAILKYI